MNWQTVMGLEIHVRLKSSSKLFSGASAEFCNEANTHACGIDVALPGTLPVLNQDPVCKAVLFGLAINAEVSRSCVFARKNYFYPDLPKGYQISQYEQPIVGYGKMEVTGKDKRVHLIGITRAHLEEDAGRSIHDQFPGKTAIDLNRAGTPLLEIVSEPEMYDVDVALAYVRKIHALVRWLGISDGNMEEGSFRCDANISLRPAGAEKLGTRTELKNLNSFRFLEKALHHEIKRQKRLLESGGVVTQETRLYDPATGETHSMRSKEEAEDYRYFPDPDLLPLQIDEAFLEQQRRALPELPEPRRARLAAAYALGDAELDRLFEDREMVDYFENCAKRTDASPRAVFSWISGVLAAALNRDRLGIAACKMSPECLAELLDCVVSGQLSTHTARAVFREMWVQGASAKDVIRKMDVGQISDEARLTEIISGVLSENEAQVAQYQAGKTNILGYFVGRVMQASAGKANPRRVSELLRMQLADSSDRSKTPSV